MTQSLCESCRWMREVTTPRSRFLLCELSSTNPAYPKYPPQPVVRCQGYQAESVNQIALALKQFLADAAPDPMSLRKFAAEIEVLPLVLDMGGCYAIRCYGDVVSFAWDTPGDVRVEEDPRIQNMAIFQGSRKYPTPLFHPGQPMPPSVRSGVGMESCPNRCLRMSSAIAADWAGCLERSPDVPKTIDNSAKFEDASMIESLLDACEFVLNDQSEPQSSFWLASQIMEMKLWRASEPDVRDALSKDIAKYGESSRFVALPDDEFALQAWK